jgi:hypothetical protein
MPRPDSQSRPRVRPAASRRLSADSAILAPTGAGIILDGPVDSSAINLLSDLLEPARSRSGSRTASNMSRVRTNNELLDGIEDRRAFNNDIFEEQDEENLLQRHELPWHRQPSPWWSVSISYEVYDPYTNNTIM